MPEFWRFASIKVLRHDRQEYAGKARMRWNCSSGITMAGNVSYALKCAWCRASSRLLKHRPKADPVEMGSGIRLATWRQGDVGMADTIPDRIGSVQHGRQCCEG